MRTIDVLSPSKLSSYFEFQRVVLQILVRDLCPSAHCASSSAWSYSSAGRDVRARWELAKSGPCRELWWRDGGCSQQRARAPGAGIHVEFLQRDCLSVYCWQHIKILHDSAPSLSAQLQSIHISVRGKIGSSTLDVSYDVLSAFCSMGLKFKYWGSVGERSNAASLGCSAIWAQDSVTRWYRAKAYGSPYGDSFCFPTTWSRADFFSVTEFARELKQNKYSSEVRLQWWGLKFYVTYCCYSNY